MKVCGLTGGVGMGKTTTARFLAERGAKVLDTDTLARELVQPGEPALGEIQGTFGAGIVDASGHLRRGELARIIFANDSARQKLEGILHPRIRALWLAQIEVWRSQGHSLAVVVIPLLFETSAQSHFEKVICTACLPGTQQDRLLARGWSPGHIAQRLAAQCPVEQKIARSDFVIWTEGQMESLARQVELILTKI